MMRRGAESHERRALWLRGLWPDRDPFRRASDRAEATVVAAALVIFLIGGPLLALAAGHGRAQPPSGLSGRSRHRGAKSRPCCWPTRDPRPAWATAA